MYQSVYYKLSHTYWSEWSNSVCFTLKIMCTDSCSSWASAVTVWQRRPEDSWRCAGPWSPWEARRSWLLSGDSSSSSGGSSLTVEDIPVRWWQTKSRNFSFQPPYILAATPIWVDLPTLASVRKKSPHRCAQRPLTVRIHSRWQPRLSSEKYKMPAC